MAEGERYIVWCPEGTTNPRVVLGSYARARMVARAMARRHCSRGQVFYVAALLSAHQQQVAMEDFDLEPGCRARRLNGER